MFERIKRGWEITKESFGIIKKDKEILVFPLIEGVFQLILFILFIVILLVGGIWASIVSKNFSDILIYIIGLIYLFFMYFIGIFFEAAIISSATIRLSGKNPNLGDGFRGPSRKIFKLFFWAIITLVVSIVLNLISKLGKGKGRGAEMAANVSAGIFGVTWSLLTFFVIPVLLFEKEGVFSSIGRSGRLFKETWGENLTAQFSVGGIFFLLGLIGLVPVVIGAFSGSVVFLVAMVILFFLYIGILVVFGTSVKGILVATLYKYAITKKEPKVYTSGVGGLFGR